MVLKKKLKQLLNTLKAKFGSFEGRVFVDSAPILERAWAKKSGLGWIGKNTNLINKQSGSFFFLAEIIVDLELNYDNSTKDYCGSCTACIDACPTDAIYEPYKLDASKCISYYTIELRDNFSSNLSMISRIGFLDVTYVKMFVLGIDSQKRMMKSFLKLYQNLVSLRNQIGLI